MCSRGRGASPVKRTLHCISRRLIAADRAPCFEHRYVHVLWLMLPGARSAPGRACLRKCQAVCSRPTLTRSRDLWRHCRCARRILTCGPDHTQSFRSNAKRRARGVPAGRRSVCRVPGRVGLASLPRLHFPLLPRPSHATGALLAPFLPCPLRVPSPLAPGSPHPLPDSHRSVGRSGHARLSPSQWLPPPLRVPVAAHARCGHQARRPRAVLRRPSLSAVDVRDAD